MTEFKPDLRIKYGQQQILNPGDQLDEGTVIRVMSASGGTIRVSKGQAIPFPPFMDYYVCYSRAAEYCAECPVNKKRECKAPLAKPKPPTL